MSSCATAWTAPRWSQPRHPPPHRTPPALAAARDRAPHPLPAAVEVTSPDPLQQALAAGADVILLDNMDSATMAEAVRLTAGRALLEASGGITLETIRAIA